MHMHIKKQNKKTTVLPYFWYKEFYFKEKQILLNKVVRSSGGEGMGDGGGCPGHGILPSTPFPCREKQVMVVK